MTFDKNGNVLTYGNKSFTWNTGRNLESIVDGNNKYSYTYDENGIRTSKTVNGKTIYYNTKDGVILSQTDGTDTLYFQYDNTGSPLGFIWNGTQYLYMTNQMGDVISITDEQGNELVQYEYDAWGKCVSTVTTHENDIEIKLANINPIRYRGYYLDNETGYYYLRSRYYNSDICRFINTDVYKYAQEKKNEFSGVCLFAYCMNNPINNIDVFGTSSKKRFDTPKSALKKWANDYFKTSLEMQRELCALLYSYLENNRLYYEYTDYAIGQKKSCDPVNQCKYYSRPQESSLVGTIHTHPNATVGGFSDADFAYNKHYRLNGYVVCKKGVYAHIYTNKPGDVVRMLEYKLGVFI